MGGALARGLVSSGALSAGSITLYDTVPDKARSLAAELGLDAIAATTPESAVESASIVVLAVKPYSVLSLLKGIKEKVTPDHLLISVAAGIKLDRLEAAAGAGIPILRVMPNSPALIGEGATAVSAGSSVTSDQLADSLALFEAVGKVVVVEEKLIDAVTGLSGSGPAYVYLMIEAMADGGVKAGLPRDTALLLAAQTVLGAAKMVLESSEHPAVLKDRVTTPGGTTIAGLAILEKKGFRSAIIEAIEAAANRSKDLS